MSDPNTSEEAPVLVPVDFSSYSEAALVWAADLARRIAAPLVVVHVVHDPAEAPGYYHEAQFRVDVDDTKALWRLEEAARVMMERFLEGVRKRHPEMQQVSLTPKLVVGVPARRILEVAEALDARLIVMGNQGRTGLSRALLGSKAEQVVRLSLRPVTIVKQADLV